MKLASCSKCFKTVDKRFTTVEDHKVVCDQCAGHEHDDWYEKHFGKKATK